MAKSVEEGGTGLLPSGSRKLKAYYAGDSNNTAATSNVVTQTVNAQPILTFIPGRFLGAFASVVADLNGDGKTDIVYSASDFGFLQVLLGNGDGNFRTSQGNSNVSVAPLATGDFNGDGKTDVVMRDLNTNNLGLWLGNGDGTLQLPVTVITTITNPFSVAVGDFNGDGKADLAIADPANGVSILLGKGDGTFQPAIAYPTSLQSAAS